MKRDLDLVRAILLRLEEGESGATPSGFSDFVEDGTPIQDIHYHVQLLNDAGLIVADEIVPGQWWPERMTWSGHEFLDAARNEELWEEMKRKVERSTGGAPFSVFHDLLLQGLRARLARAPAQRRKKSRARQKPRRQ